VTPELLPLLAGAVDLLAGDPPNRWHPVAWQGNLLAALERRAPPGDGAHFLWGGAVLAAGVCLSAAAAALVEALASRLPLAPGLLLRAATFKLALSGHGLDRAVGAVQAALLEADLPEARRLLSWHLVSRPTAELSAEEVAGAAVESAAENLTDALVAPLLAWLAGGLPGVWAYRFVQTADSMWGYHDAAHEWLGKPAARLDDALNWLPARAAALLLWLSAAICGEDAAGAWRARGTLAGQTASPNAGQTMATAAGALGITLTKRGHYALCGGDAPLTAETVARARRLVRVAGLLAVVLASAGALAGRRRTRQP
jgi:adenosylcobinamide-phosphate synthase